MNKLTKLAAMLVVSSPLLIKAQGYQVNFQGQVQQGMGSAGAALMQDGAALFFNPGGMSHLKGNHIDLGITPTFANGQFVDSNTGAMARTESPVSTPFAAYGVFGSKDSTKFLSKFKFGLGIYTPFGSTVDWEKGWGGRYALTHLQLKAIYFQPTVSYKITDKLGFGAGFVYVNGAVNLQKDIPVFASTDVTLSNPSSVELNGKASGFGANVGIYYKPIEKLSIGLTYRSKVNMKVSEGDVTFTMPAGVNPVIAANFPNQKFTSELPLPQVITLGLAFKATDKLDLALDINNVGWKAYDTLAFDYDNNTAGLKDTKSPREYKSIFAFRLGGQYKITDAFTVRLGGGYALTPVQDGFVTPETPDANRVYGTLGLGYTIKQKFSINASVYYTSLKREGTNFETNLTGTYQTKVIAPGLALSYKF